jgi:hypothetical protein
MVDKIEEENQIASPVTPTLQPARTHLPSNAWSGNGGTRAGAGRPKGATNKVTRTFRDALLQAVSEVGDSQEVGKDGQGGLVGFLKMCTVLERKTTLMLLGRILPLKISAEVKQSKENLSIEEAVAELKACGMEPLLALYLKRYPIDPNEKNTEWSQTIDMSLAPDIENGTE